MLNREKDVPHCGVDEEKIRSANPKINLKNLKFYHLYLSERHKIYKKKEIEKLPPPWTSDEVLDKFRFTNVRRELDRESVWLIDNISTSSTLTIKEKILWSILFRAFNKSETFLKLCLPNSLSILDFGDDEIEELRKVIDKETEKDPKYVWYTPAFNTGGLKSAHAFPNLIKDNTYLNNPRLKATIIKEDGTRIETSYREARDHMKDNPNHFIEGYESNIPLRMFYMVKSVRESGIVEKILKSESQIEVFNHLISIHGIAKFLGYQIFVDFTYIPEFPFSENEFTISGPGCTRGLNYLFDDKDGLTDEELLFWVRDNIEKVFEENGLEFDIKELFDHLPPEDRKLNVMMIENSFCENSKLTKAKLGKGRPRNNYKKENYHGIL